MFYQQHSRCQEAASCMLVWTRLANPKGERKIWQWKGKLSHSQFQTCSFILHDYSQTHSGQEMTHKYIRSLLTVQTTALSEKKPPSAPNTCCTSTTEHLTVPYRSTSFSSQRNMSIFSMGLHHKFIRCDVSPWGLRAMNKAQWHWASDRPSLEHVVCGPSSLISPPSVPCRA